MPTNEMTSLNIEKNYCSVQDDVCHESQFPILTSCGYFVASVQVGNRNLRGLQIVDHVSISSDCCMFVIQSFAFPHRFYKSHCADSMVFEYILHSEFSWIFRFRLLTRKNDIPMRLRHIARQPTRYLTNDLRYFSSSCHLFLSISCAFVHRA